jgi:hypothetical protein
MMCVAVEHDQRIEKREKDMRLFFQMNEATSCEENEVSKKEKARNSVSRFKITRCVTSDTVDQ